MKRRCAFCRRSGRSPHSAFPAFCGRSSCWLWEAWAQVVVGFVVFGIPQGLILVALSGFFIVPSWIMYIILGLLWTFGLAGVGVGPELVGVGGLW